MALFKTVKKPVIKGATAGGAEISPQRPVYVPKTASCIGTLKCAQECPCGYIEMR